MAVKDKASRVFDGCIPCVLSTALVNYSVLKLVFVVYLDIILSQ